MTTEEKKEYYFYKIKGVNYIGSSHCNLIGDCRVKRHNSRCFTPNEQEYHLKVYKYIREQTNISNIELEILHTGKYTRLERLKKEQEFIDFVKQHRKV